MLAGIKNILIIVNKGQLNQFRKILPEKNNIGLKLNIKNNLDQLDYLKHLQLEKNLLAKIMSHLFLGDNFFYGQSLTKTLKKIRVSKRCKNFSTSSQKS